MILLMLSASLAGCTSGDPDGDDNSGIDMEILNQMIDDNLQDFINNTSVTVNQEIHYHNNTTYVTNEYHNTTNNEGNQVTENNFNTDYTNYSLSQVGNGSGTDEILFIMHLELNTSQIASNLIPRVDIDPRTLVYNYTKNFTGYVWVDSNNSNQSNGWYEEAWISITHQIPCSVFYVFEEQLNETYGINHATFWEQPWNYENYFGGMYGWNDSEQTSDLTGFDYIYAGSESEDYCNPTWHPWIAYDYDTEIGRIDVPEGYLISGGVIEYYHTWDNYSYTGQNYSLSQNYYNPLYYDEIFFEKESGQLTNNGLNNYGGWEDLTVNINLCVRYLFEHSEFTITIMYSFTPVIPVN